jgi:hypothetical protein
VTARVYFGQLAAITDALAGQVTFNTSASMPSYGPEGCVLTLVFGKDGAVAGVVYAEGLGPGWLGMEFRPSQPRNMATFTSR